MKDMLLVMFEVKIFSFNIDTFGLPKKWKSEEVCFSEMWTVIWFYFKGIYHEVFTGHWKSTYSTFMVAVPLLSDNI